jgi:hypothetical protein
VVLDYGPKWCFVRFDRIMMAARGSGNEIHFQVKLGSFVGLGSAEFIVRKRVSFFYFLEEQLGFMGRVLSYQETGFRHIISCSCYGVHDAQMKRRSKIQ